MFWDHYWRVSDRQGEVYSSKKAAYVPDTDPGFLTWLAQSETGAIPIGSHEEIVDVLREHNVPPYHRVYTFTIVERLAAAGLLQAAEIAISSDVSAKWRFTVATQVDADDVETRALLTAIGANPDEILAPE